MVSIVKATSGHGSSDDAYTRLFGSNYASLARQKSRKFSGYDTSGNPVYHYTIMHANGRIYQSYGTVSGQKYNGAIRSTPQPRSDPRLTAPGDVTSDQGRQGVDYGWVNGVYIPPAAVRKQERDAMSDSMEGDAVRRQVVSWLSTQAVQDFYGDKVPGMMSQLNGLTAKQIYAKRQDWFNAMRSAGTLTPVFDDFGGGAFPDLGGGGGGGGGGGFGGPQYRAPDKRKVESFVKGEMVDLIGTVVDSKVKSLVDLYMRDHKADFDSLDREIDPGVSVAEAIRNSDEFKQIHELRPDSEDERQWIAQRRVAAAQGGLNVERQEDFAIQQASIGGDVGDVQEAAAFRQWQGSGTTQGTPLNDRLRMAATNMMRNVR